MKKIVLIGIAVVAVGMVTVLLVVKCTQPSPEATEDKVVQEEETAFSG